MSAFASASQPVFVSEPLGYVEEQYPYSQGAEVDEEEKRGILQADYPELQRISDEFEISIVVPTDNELSEHPGFLIFIGRLNPPHPGHIATIVEMIHNALGSEPKKHVLILLGSGPRLPGMIGMTDKRTLDNPITFELKSRILMEKLMENFDSEVIAAFVTIQEMTNLSLNVQEFISSKVTDSTLNIQEIQVTHYAGGKDDDAGKFSGVFKGVESRTENSFGVPVVIESLEVDASQAGGRVLSATHVRKTIYTLLRGRLSTGITNTEMLVHNIDLLLDTLDPSIRSFYERYTIALIREVIFPVTRVLTPTNVDDIIGILQDYNSGNTYNAVRDLNILFKPLKAVEAVKPVKSVKSVKPVKVESRLKKSSGGSKKTKRRKTNRRRRTYKKSRRSHL